MALTDFQRLDDRLRDLETGMAAMVQQLDDHTTQDAAQFGSLRERLIGLDTKIDEILIYQAERRGALQEARLAGAKWGGSIGLLLVGIFEAVKALI